MASSGSCSTTAATSQSCYMTFSWEQTKNEAKNQSTISWWVTGHLNYGHVVVSELSVYINGTSVCYHSTSEHTTVYEGTVKASGTTVIKHAADGTASLEVSIGAGIYNWAINCRGSGSWTLDANAVYALSMSAGDGSSITVNRTSSGYGGTGALADGAKLYKDDTLKITFTAGTNYAITNHTVNGSTFISGNTHTVSGDVAVIATATPLKSLIGATDANIGSTSTITVTRYNPSFTHTITYSFGSESGTVVTKGTDTSISWTVPTAFYAQIPNDKTGICTLTIETFNESTSLGTNTCTLTVTASAAACAPSVSGSVVDSNAATVALTGDSAILIRYKSTAKCTINVAAKNSATIQSRFINDVAPTNDEIVIPNVSASSFVFTATDSRGYTSSQTITPLIVAYINLTCNPVITRLSPTGGGVVMNVSGDYYRGSFGASSNALTIRYRYMKSTESAYGSWTDIPPASYTIGTESYSGTSISLGDTFDYRASYIFQIQAYDSVSSVTKTITLQRGIPIFDWGEDDFKFHVPVQIDGALVLNKDGALYDVSDKLAQMQTLGERTEIPTGSDLDDYLTVGCYASRLPENVIANQPTSVEGGAFVLDVYNILGDDVLTIVPGTTPSAVFRQRVIGLDGNAAERFVSTNTSGTVVYGIWITWLNTENLKSELLKDVHKIGSVYMSFDSTSPASLFGGTWEQVKDCFLLASGDTYAAGSTGGEATHKLTTAEMPSHKHSYYEFPGYDANNGYRIGGSSIWTYWYWYDANTGSVGGDQPHNNMPPYLAVYVWKRIA